MPPRYVDAYCDIASFEPGQPILIGHDSSECTLIEIFGLKSIYSIKEATDAVAEYLGSPMASLFQNPGHKLSISFEVSQNIEGETTNLYETMARSAQQKGLELQSLIDESQDIVNRNAVRIKVLLACWTLPGAAYKDEVKAARAKVKAERKARSFTTLNAQSDDLQIEPVDSAHKAFVEIVRVGLSEANISFRVLGPDEKNASIRHDLVEIRQGILFHETPDDWSPRYAGLRRYPAAKKAYDVDASEFFAPRISQQIMTSTAQAVPKKRSIDIGGRSYALMYVDLFPREPRSFDSLYRTLRSHAENFPFRITFHIDGGKFSPGLMHVVAGFASLASGESKNIYNTNKALIEAVARGQGSEFAKTRILACTWKEPHEPAEVLERRRALLMRGMSSWGDGQMADVPTNPMQTLCETVPGMTVGSRTGKGTFVPVGDSFRMLPMTTTSPIFSEGESVFLTLDGRIAPYKAFSPQMQYWITTIFATPGSGKSVLMNRLNIEFVSYYVGRNLPFLLCIDLGVSSSGFIRVIREALPPHQKHLAAYIRPSNSRSYAINPFDIGLGRRTPLAREATYIRSFLMRLIDVPTEGELRQEMGLMVAALVQKLYQRSSDLETNSEPRKWEPGVDPELDVILRKHGLALTATKTFWWRIVDELAVRGDYANASRAQRHAVPTLSDSASILASDDFAKNYSEGALRIARLALNAAIDTYPIFANATKLDLGVARVAAVDLQDLAQRDQSPDAERNNTLMFMAARSLLIQNISGHDEEIKDMEFPREHAEMYASYWQKRHADMGEYPKRLAMDEVHVTGAGPDIQAVLSSDGREGRKWGLELVLASQFLKDFKALTSLCSCAMILNQENEKTRAECRDVYGFSDAVEDVLKKHVHGPQAGRGANVLMRFMINESERWVVLNNRIGPTMLWALNTRREDRLVRDALYERMTASEALAFLARRYPAGTALDHYNRVAATMDSTDDDGTSVARKMVDSLMVEFLNLRAA
ncbi:hypothetical protein AD951_04100 [Acetobacter malorum]|uniref:Uncharacterized protein n=1 Tax=Acetobacter malorum TaxID=178901 RepID=A0A149UPU9_9PROT|nr:hypothetical protein [Acetobacter malorum]KXV70029.1 hypothetical protein AD951_04100 [Acetobacter malorum]